MRRPCRTPCLRALFTARPTAACPDTLMAWLQDCRKDQDAVAEQCMTQEEGKGGVEAVGGAQAGIG